MFHLESSITEWRNQMLAAGVRSPVPLVELETHLREELEIQMQSGVEEEKALAFAIQKIGDAPGLKIEFSKTGGAASSARWEKFIAGVVALGIVIPLGAWSLLKNDLSPAWRLAGFADLAVITFAVLGSRHLNRMFPVIPAQRVRTLIGAAFGLAGITGMIVFANFILPKVELTQGQLTVLVLWSLTVMAAFGAIWAGLEEAARKSLLSSRS